MDREKSKDQAKIRLQQQIDDATLEIENLSLQLQQYDEELDRINAENEEEAQHMEEVSKRNAIAEKNPRDIAAEDALDTIVRLENTLKLQQRRNVLLQRENGTQEKLLKERSKLLQKVTNEDHDLVKATGYHDGMDGIDMDEFAARVDEMINLEGTLNRELSTAKVLIQKKVQLLETLNADLADKKEKEEKLYLLFNDIRVVDRDCQEVQAQIDEITHTDKKNETAMEIVQNSRDVVAISSLQGDKEYLSREIETYKVDRRRQDEVIKAQLSRARQLQTRMDIIMAALRDLKLDKELEREIAGAALIPSSDEDPSDLSRIQPVDEMLPVETFKLLHRDNEAMRTSVARKDVMVLEKQAAVDALDSKVQMVNEQLSVSTMEQGQAKTMRANEMDELQVELQAQHHDFRKEIEELLSRNLKLKAKLMKQPAPQQKKSSDMHF